MKIYDENASVARFLLGGIGTGNVSLDQNGRLCDFEIWNKPNKGYRNPFTFFAIRAGKPNGTSVAKALESKLPPPYIISSQGANYWETGGLSRFRHSQMSGKYPFVNFTFADETMPVEAALEAFTPFVPLATDDSSLPAAVLRYTIKNTSDVPLEVSVAGSMVNLTVFDQIDSWMKPLFNASSINRYTDNGKVRGIHFLNSARNEADPSYLEMALLTTEEKGTSYLENWSDNAWWDMLFDFWNDFASDGELEPNRPLKGKAYFTPQDRMPAASLCIKKTVKPGEEAVFPFIISWYHPNRVRAWYNETPNDRHPLVKNYYAKFGNAIQSASYLAENLERLEGQSRCFVNALWSSSLPDYVKEAVANNITVIRSNTCFRMEDGTFFAWEGCHDKVGSCDGNCTHVWNYTQTMAFLFPELERSMRRTEFIYETDPDGRMFFRANRYMGGPDQTNLPAADGQLGTIIRLYRDWKLCGDDGFLKEMWPKAKLALEYAFSFWDKDGDGVLDGQAHNTYDIEFYGITSMLSSIFYAALRAGEEICLYLGDNASVQKYKNIREKGAEKLDGLTFNGEYYEQFIDDVDEYKHQYGRGCLADQLLGQQLSHVSGLGYVFNKDHVRAAVKSIYNYNFVENFSGFNNLQRMYAMNDDGGLLLCTWPKGGKPETPFVYCDEVWTGIEYQVAAHLIYEGLVDEGLKLVEACRARYDGIKRSPWSEIECGHHYARSLASYGVLLALSGFRCDAVNKTLHFKPAINSENFSTFFCCADGWGIFRQKKTGGEFAGEIETLYGNLDDYKIVID